MKKVVCFLVSAMLLSASVAQSQEISDSQLKFFESKIRPALVKYCYECHSVEHGDSRGGLLVDTRTSLLEGGDSGPAIEPGNIHDSLIWEAITWDGYEMPPSKKMPDSVIADFKTWIEMGALDPRVRELLEIKTKLTPEAIEEARKEHWSFQAPKADKSTNIDELVSKKLEDANLKPSKPADPFTLLRRIHFDLIGLPPTPIEINKFHTAYTKNPEAALKAKVKELLDRPQYGERWGRHWMDVARYAESSGSRNVSYPWAWRYRNYVIDSFNDDTPYDRFVQEQIAGDLLPVKSDEQWQENLIATGFLAIGLKHQDQKNPRVFISDMVDEQIDTTTQAVLGLTVACARCHDHKYDPIPTDDYYSLAGIFYSTKTYYGTTRVGQNHRPSDLLLLPVQDNASGAASSQQSIASMKDRIANLDEQMRGASGKDRRGIRNAKNRIASQLAALNADGSAKSFGMGVQEADSMVNANILLGGEVDKPAQEVTRGFVQVLGDLNFTETSNKASGRMKLVKAMTSKDNPLTARVMVNRIWMHLLGKPLVETPSNFGFSGMKPENQELLDYLAVRFMEKDWSIKQMITEIVMSETYQRSSSFNEKNYEADPDNKLLWRANPRQIDAEALRDAMIAFSGRLNLDRPDGSAAQSMGGRPGSSNTNADSTYRSVYLPIVRDKLPASLELFDFPDPNVTSAGRAESIVPTQALYLMNGEFVSTQAAGMAALLEENFDSTNEQVRNAFLWIYGRPPSDAEIQASVKFFEEYRPSKAPEQPKSSSNLAAAKSAPVDPKAAAFFNEKIQPILAQNCMKCHSSRGAKGGLAIDSKHSLLNGGDRGPAIDLDEPESSLLLTSIKYTDEDLQMPPKSKLKNSQIADIKKWLEMGAPYPQMSSTQQQSGPRGRRGQQAGGGPGQQRGSGNGPGMRRGDGQAGGGPGQQRGGGRRRGAQSESQANAPTTQNQTLVVFCQTLMASADFRLLN